MTEKDDPLTKALLLLRKLYSDLLRGAGSTNRTEEPQETSGPDGAKQDGKGNHHHQ